MIEINNKYLIGTHIMFYEIEMVPDHINSIVNAVNRVRNKQNITVDLFFNISEYFEKVDRSKITRSDLIKKFMHQVKAVEATGCNVTHTVYNKLAPLTMVDYRRDLNYFGCADTDYVIWGESDALLPEQAFEVLENIKNYATQNNVNKYVVTFALRKTFE